MKKILKAILIVVIIVLIITTIFLVLKMKNKKQISIINEMLLDNNENNSSSKKSIFINVDDTNIIGTIKIEKIGFEGIIYEGTELDVLEKGVGHFSNTPIIDGNVCLAAHNSRKFWAKLDKLTEGDIITYNSTLGNKKYSVYQISTIDDTDWSLLQNNNKNIITLITCVHGKPSKRLCVQGIEVQKNF